MPGSPIRCKITCWLRYHQPSANESIRSCTRMLPSGQKHSGPLHPKAWRFNVKESRQLLPQA